MTYEEAKIQIQAIPEKIWDQLSEPDREAMEMAFSALQAQELSKNSPKLDSGNGELATNLQPTCNNDGDLISRQAAFEALNCINGTAELDKAFEAIESLPPAQPDTKAQLPGEGTTSDCISRQAAIEALKRISFLQLFECGEYLLEDTRVIEIISSSKALEAIEALPSAQPEKRTEERTETHACDCISRKTAIDAAIEAADEWDGGYSKERERMIRLTLLGLPSAQPEIIRCKDCKYRGGLSGFYCDIVEKAVGVDSFCSWAERKTDDLQ